MICNHRRKQLSIHASTKDGEREREREREGERNNEIVIVCHGICVHDFIIAMRRKSLILAMNLTASVVQVKDESLPAAASKFENNSDFNKNDDNNNNDNDNYHYCFYYYYYCYYWYINNINNDNNINNITWFASCI